MKKFYLLLMMSVALLCGGCGQDFKETREKAEQGDAEAQFKIGEMYAAREGFFRGGVPQDYVEAAKWYWKAAEQGDADAQLKLGRLYFSGKGVPEDHVEAAKWVRKAAEQGNARAQKDLSVMYFHGWGVLKDEVEAYAWYLLAEENGADDGKEWISDLKKGLTAEQMEKGKARALELHRLIEERKEP